MNKRRRYKAKRKRREAKQPIDAYSWKATRTRLGDAMSYRDAIRINGEWH